MFLAFLKSPFYDRIVRMTQYREPYYGSDSDDEIDEENQYEMIRTNDTDIKNTENKYKSNFNESDYYFISYEDKDTVFERRGKDCLNYSAIFVCILTHAIVVYVIFYHII